MRRFKLKTLEQLRERIQTHYNLYKDYLHVGKIRAEGKLWCNGRLSYNQSNQGGSITIEKFNIEVPINDKAQPHFKGQCQAMGTGDTFSVAAWINRNGSIRIEITEKEGYCKNWMSNNPPF